MAHDRTALNRYTYLIRRNAWMVDPRFIMASFSRTEIREPIFLLGNQGGGLTLLSRMLRRNQVCVSPTGNWEYWSGADELQNVFGPALTAPLTGLRHKAPPHPVLTPPRSWSYGSDALVKVYRKRAGDANEIDKRSLERVIRYCVNRFSKTAAGRFVDKSQVFTLRLGFINALLQEYNPRFVLLLRNPYIECVRAAEGKAGDMARYVNVLDREERLDLCAQHWGNSINAALEDSAEQQIDLKILKFEDLLTNPVEELKEVCQHVNLSFSPQMLPSPNDSIPLGSRYRNRWYPLKPDINQKYIGHITAKDITRINDVCGDTIKTVGYEPL